MAAVPRARLESFGPPVLEIGGVSDGCTPFLLGATAPSAAVPRARLGAFGLKVLGRSGAPPVSNGSPPPTVVDADHVPSAPLSPWMMLPPSGLPGCSTAPSAAVRSFQAL